MDQKKSEAILEAYGKVNSDFGGIFAKLLPPNASVPLLILLIAVAL